MEIVDKTALKEKFGKECRLECDMCGEFKVGCKVNECMCNLVNDAPVLTIKEMVDAMPRYIQEAMYEALRKRLCEDETAESKDQIEEVLEELLDLADRDCYGEYQFGYRAGMMKAYEIIRKVV